MVSTPRGKGTPMKHLFDEVAGTANRTAGHARTLNFTVKPPRALVRTVTALPWLQTCCGTIQAVCEHSQIVTFLCRLKPEPVSVTDLCAMTVPGLATILGPCLAATPPGAAAAAAALTTPTPTPAASTALASIMTRFTRHLTSDETPFPQPSTRAPGQRFPAIAVADSMAV